MIEVLAVFLALVLLGACVAHAVYRSCEHDDTIPGSWCTSGPAIGAVRLARFVLVLALWVWLVSCATTRDAAVTAANTAHTEGIAAHEAIESTCPRVYAEKGLAEGDRICGPATAAYNAHREAHEAAKQALSNADDADDFAAIARLAAIASELAAEVKRMLAEAHAR
jgi:hypothetical protein